MIMPQYFKEELVRLTEVSHYTSLDNKKFVLTLKSLSKHEGLVFKEMDGEHGIFYEYRNGKYFRYILFVPIKEIVPLLIEGISIEDAITTLDL